MADDPPRTAPNPERERARLHYEELRADAADRIKYQVEYSHAALKGLTIVNGGAIIALFTFIGNDRSAALHLNPTMIWWAFAAFALGLIATLIATFAAFFSQSFYMASSMYESWNRQAEMLGMTDDYDHKTPYHHGEIAENVGLVSASLALLFFVAGSAIALAGVLP